jgi:hypothetical protein
VKEITKFQIMQVSLHGTLNEILIDYASFLQKKTSSEIVVTIYFIFHNSFLQSFQVIQELNGITFLSSYTHFN